VTSLYGESFESLSPSAAELADVDVLLVDLQDVGSRYYTFIWTMALCLQSAARAGVSVWCSTVPIPSAAWQSKAAKSRPGPNPSSAWARFRSATA
jgi:uncharacterized protein YbbC (DUF1343 family)